MSNTGDMAASIRLQRVTCIEANEVNDQPYIWPIFAKLDDEALYYALKDETTIARVFSTSLQGEALYTKEALDKIYRVAPPASAWFHAPGGTRGNLPVSDQFTKGKPVDIPQTLGYFSRPLKRKLTADDALIAAVAVIMEEDSAIDFTELLKIYQTFYLTLFETLVVTLIEQAGDMHQTLSYTSGNPPLIDASILKKSIPEIESTLEWAIQNSLVNQVIMKVLPDDFIGCKVVIRKALDLTTNSAPTFAKTLDKAHGSKKGSYKLEGSVAGLAVPYYPPSREVTLADTPTAFAIDGYQHVFYHDSNDHVHELWFDGARKVWHQGDLMLPHVASADKSVDTDLAPTSFWYASDNSQHVEFCVKSSSQQDGRATLALAELRESGGTWDITQLSSPVAPTSSPRGLRRGNDYCVVYTGTDRHLHAKEYSLSKKTWTDKDLTPNYRPLTPDEAPPGVPCGYALNVTTLEVFYRDARGSIKCIDSSFSGNWAAEIDLTAQTSAPPAFSDPHAFFRDSDQSGYVVYVAKTDHTIHVLRRVQGEWKQLAPATEVKCPMAVGNPFGLVWTYDNSLHIVHRGAGATGPHIFDLYNSGGKWGIKDVSTAVMAAGNALIASLPTALTGGMVPKEYVSPKSDPVAWSWKTDNGMHIVFDGFDDHLHEFVAVPGKEWTFYDLFQSLGV